MTTEEGAKEELILNLFYKWKLQVSNITSLGSNNSYVFKVDLRDRLKRDVLLSENQPGTSAVPSKTASMVVRITHAGAGLADTFQVQNAVAIMSLARHGLSAFPKKLVPMVFAWADVTPDEPGWMAIECMEGAVIRDGFDHLTREQKRTVLEQIAKLVKSLQTFELPVSTFGGLGFDDRGNYVGRPMTLPCGGPFETYQALCRGMLEWQFTARKSIKFLNEHDELDIIPRVERFLADPNGSRAVLSRMPSSKPVIIHADLVLLNILFNPDTLQLTAVVDWDFSHLASPISEYLHSLQQFHAFVEPPDQGTDDEKLLRTFILSKFPDELPETKARENKKRVPGVPMHIDWEVARDFDACLRAEGAAKPSNIQGAEDVADFWWFTQELCPWWCMHERSLSRMGAEMAHKKRIDAQDTVNRQLKEWGY